MPHQPTVSEESEFDGLPDGSQTKTRSSSDGLMVTASSMVWQPTTFTAGAAFCSVGTKTGIHSGVQCRCESRLMSACVREFSRADVETELSSVGNSLLQAWHFGDLTPLSHKQAHVYALREKKAGFSRDETAAILNISPVLSIRTCNEQRRSWPRRRTQSGSFALTRTNSLTPIQSSLTKPGSETMRTVQTTLLRSRKRRGTAE